jgi:hypothetical protein
MRHLHLLILVWLGHGRIVRRIGCAVVCVGAHTSEFEPDTRPAWPAVRRRGIAFDFPPPTSLASSHDWTSVSQRGTRTVGPVKAYPSIAYGDYAHRRRHNLQKP